MLHDEVSLMFNTPGEPHAAQHENGHVEEGRGGPPGKGTGARGTEEGGNEAPEPDDLIPDATDEIKHAREGEFLPPRCPGQVGQSLINVNGSPDIDEHHTTTDGQIELGATAPRTPQATQTDKGQGKCKLECYQARHSHLLIAVQQLGFIQAGEMWIIQIYLLLDEDATRFVTDHYQAIKGQQFPDWDSGGPAKCGTCESIYCSSEDKNL